MIRAALVGDPPGRLDALIARQVDSPRQVPSLPLPAPRPRERWSPSVVPASDRAARRRAGRPSHATSSNSVSSRHSTRALVDQSVGARRPRRTRRAAPLDRGGKGNTARRVRRALGGGRRGPSTCRSPAVTGLTPPSSLSTLAGIPAGDGGPRRPSHSTTTAPHPPIPRRRRDRTRQEPRRPGRRRPDDRAPAGRDAVGRIDIVYVCSNADIAEQNVKRLDVIGQQHAIATRLTLLLAAHASSTASPSPPAKPVNLVSFTPGTLVRQQLADGHDSRSERCSTSSSATTSTCDGVTDRSSMLLFQDGVTAAQRPFETGSTWTAMKPDRTAESSRTHRRREFIATEPVNAASSRQYRALPRRDPRHAGPSPRGRGERAGELIGRSSEPNWHERASTRSNPTSSSSTSSSGSETCSTAARATKPPSWRTTCSSSATPRCCSCRRRRTSRSRSPRRPRPARITSATCARSSTSSPRGSDLDPTAITADLAEYRRCADQRRCPSTTPGTASKPACSSVMCRTERPRVGDDGMLDERTYPVGPVPAEDIVGCAACTPRLDARRADHRRVLEVGAVLRQLPRRLQARASGSASSSRRRAAGDELRGRCSASDPRPRSTSNTAARSTSASARLRALAERHGRARSPRPALGAAVAALPRSSTGPSLTSSPPRARSSSVLVMGGDADGGRLVALSYEADRRIGTPATDRSRRLEYSDRGRSPGAMTTLALFWPNPELARHLRPTALADPRARWTASPRVELRGRAEAAIDGRLPSGTTSRATTAEAAYWQAAIGSFGRAPVWPRRHRRDRRLRSPASRTRRRRARRAEPPQAPCRAGDFDDRRHAVTTSSRPTSPTVVAQLGLHAPGNIAWRALGRLLRPGHRVTAAGHWRAAATLASGFPIPVQPSRVDRHPRPTAPRRDVLASGPHLLRVGRPASRARRAPPPPRDRRGRHGPLDDDDASRTRAAGAIDASPCDPSDLLSVRPAPTRAGASPSPAASRSATAPPARATRRPAPGDPRGIQQPVLAVGSGDHERRARKASTSTGGAARSSTGTRRPTRSTSSNARAGSIATAVWPSAATSPTGIDPLSLPREPSTHGTPPTSCGLDERGNLGELAPHWVYPGPARIQRTVLPYPLSTDAARYRRLKDDLALYRLTFGQPRQEDLLEILKRRGVQHDPARADELRLRLNPPSRT